MEFEESSPVDVTRTCSEQNVYNRTEERIDSGDHPLFAQIEKHSLTASGNTSDGIEPFAIDVSSNLRSKSLHGSDRFGNESLFRWKKIEILTPFQFNRLELSRDRETSKPSRFFLRSDRGSSHTVGRCSRDSSNRSSRERRAFPSSRIERSNHEFDVRSFCRCCFVARITVASRSIDRSRPLPRSRATSTETSLDALSPLCSTNKERGGTRHGEVGVAERRGGDSPAQWP